MAGKSGTAKAAEAFDKIVDFLESFEDLADPRQRGKVLYPLDEILLLVLLGVLAGCESWVEIARFGDKHLRHPRRRAVPALLHRLGGGPDPALGRHHRHRRQDAAALLSGGWRQGADPHDLGVVVSPEPRARASQGR